MKKDEKSPKSLFLNLTSSRYTGMVDRCKKYKYAPPEFTLVQLREMLLGYYGMDYRAVRQCRYCHKPMGIEDIAIDHEIPLSRGGFSELSNIGFPCPECNQRKGKMTPAEFTKLIAFLEKEIPLARIDVLKRLQMAVKLAAGRARDIMMRKKALEAQGIVSAPRKRDEPPKDQSLFGVPKKNVPHAGTGKGRDGIPDETAGIPF